MKKYLAFILCMLAISATARAQSPATIPNNKVVIGKTGAADKIIEFNLTKAGASANPKVKYNNSVSRIQYSNDGTTFLDLVSGGGGSLRWVESANAPIFLPDTASNGTYLYTAGAGQNLYASVKVPTSYGGGTQVKMYVQFYSPDTSGTVLLQSVATLIRTGVDAYTSTTNQRTSTNAAVTLSGGTQNIPQTVILDLTSSSGQINGVNVSANDTISVNLTRGTDTATSEISALVFGAEVTTQ